MAVFSSSEAAGDPAHRRSRLLFQGGNFLFWLSLYFYVPILSVYAQSMGASLALVGVMLSAYGVTQLLLRIPTGVASDLVGRRKPFVLTRLALTVLAALVFLWAPAPWALVTARGLSGVAATAWVVITVMFSGYFPPAQTASAIGLMGTTNGLGQIIATWTGGLAAEAYGWGAPFVLAGASGTAGVFLMALCREPTAPRRASVPISWRRLWAVGTTPALLVVAGLSALNTFTNYTTIFGFIPIYAHDLGATKAQLGALTALSLIPSTLVQPLTAPLARRVGFTTVVVAGLALTGATTLAVPLTHTFTALLVTQIVGGVGRGVLGASLMSLAILGVAQEERATSMGVYQAVYSIGMFLGPLVGGIVGQQAGLPVVFVTTGLLSLGAALAALAALPRIAGITHAAPPNSPRNHVSLSASAAPPATRRPATL